ncbi:MAG: hypothetical protein JNK11_03795 [Alphaproteobacteria bacterium]|nr:hypothetical protein [Alphaproteobacteria bacterium]
MPPQRGSKGKTAIELGSAFRGSVERLSHGQKKRISEFVRLKQRGQPVPGVDKVSGQRPDGTLFEPFLQRRICHYHLSERKRDPILIYQDLQERGRIRLIVVCDHSRIFAGQEGAFMAEFDRDLDSPEGASGR